MYGSLINTLGAGGKNTVTPEIGMGVTFFYWSDRAAGTITEIINAKTIRVKGDTATRTDDNGMSDAQSYTYEHATSPGPGQIYTLRKNGRWIKQGQPMKGGQTIGLGYRDAHYDYSF